MSYRENYINWEKGLWKGYKIYVCVFPPGGRGDRFHSYNMGYGTIGIAQDVN